MLTAISSIAKIVSRQEINHMAMTWVPDGKGLYPISGNLKGHPFAVKFSA